MFEHILLASGKTHLFSELYKIEWTLGDDLQRTITTIALSLPRRLGSVATTRPNNLYLFLDIVLLQDSGRYEPQDLYEQ